MVCKTPCEWTGNTWEALDISLPTIYYTQKTTFSKNFNFSVAPFCALRELVILSSLHNTRSTFLYQKPKNAFTASEKSRSRILLKNIYIPALCLFPVRLLSQWNTRYDIYHYFRVTEAAKYQHSRNSKSLTEHNACFQISD